LLEPRIPGAGDPGALGNFFAPQTLNAAAVRGVLLFREHRTGAFEAKERGEVRATQKMRVLACRARW